jgi:hypothetical protein
MPHYVVTFTSMVIEADSPEDAIDKAGDFKGGGSWEADLMPSPCSENIDTGPEEAEDISYKLA